MYKTSIIERPAHFFKTFEVFIAAAEMDPERLTVDWSIPAPLHDDFLPFVASVSLSDPRDAAVIETFERWFSEKLGLPDGALQVSTSAYYVPERVDDAFDECVRYNRVDAIDRLMDNSLSPEYLDPDQKCAAYVLAGEIVSIAYDNCGGFAAVRTLPECRNKGYATACLKRLISAYRDDKEELGFGTTLSNAAAIRVAEKCGMRNASCSYWVKVGSDYGYDLREARRELFA